MSEARSWSNTPRCAADGGQDMVAVFAQRGKGKIASYRGNYVSLAH